MNLPLREFSEILSVMRPQVVASPGSEKRVASRMLVAARVQAHILEGNMVRRSYSLFARDLSLSGLGAIQSIVLTKGTELLLELPRESTPIYVRSVIVRSSNLADGLMAIGTEFTTVASDQLLQNMNKRIADESARIQRMVFGS